jgi:vacuolar protein sorting-associated protein 16
MVAATAALRVLNALRAADVGVALTYAQYRRLGPQRLAMRLAARRQHYLALQV